MWKSSLCLLLLFFCFPVLGATYITEEDGSPVAKNPTTWKFANGVITVNTDGSISIASGAGALDWTVDQSPTDIHADNIPWTSMWVTAPCSPIDTGTAGEAAYTDSYLFVCTNTDTWKRLAWDSWTVTDALLLESGDALLLESGDKLLLE